MKTQLCSFICTAGRKGLHLLGDMEAHWLAELEDLLTRFFQSKQTFPVDQS